MSNEGSIDGLDAAIANNEEDEDADDFVGKREAPLEHEDDEEGKVVVGLMEKDATCCWRFDEEDPPSNDGRLFVWLGCSILVNVVACEGGRYV